MSNLRNRAAEFQSRRLPEAPPPPVQPRIESQSAGPADPDAARIIAARLYALHGPRKPFRPKGWDFGDGAAVARILFECGKCSDYCVLGKREQRRVHLYVRAYAEADGIVWPDRGPGRPVSHRVRFHLRAADRKAARGGVA